MKNILLPILFGVSLSFAVSVVGVDTDNTCGSYSPDFKISNVGGTNPINGFKIYASNEKQEYNLISLNEYLEGIKIIHEISPNKFIFENKVLMKYSECIKFCRHVFIKHVLPKLQNPISLLNIFELFSLILAGIFV